MGVKDLWTILTPHCDRKPIFELQGKVVAIDLAGWVCESLNVVDYFVHPRHHLKNLFFRTAYLIMEGVTPIFVLEGVAPKLKSQTIAKRNELQFRGVKPKNTPPQSSQEQARSKKPNDKGRTRFNHVLKQCENLLQSMGIHCVQGPGEAEAYCAFLNSKGLVDGVISQDSDCFAYGALVVYRNFSVSTQGNSAAQGGAVDVYSMDKICAAMDFGQNKIIVMALLCGCDYCPEGIGGIGKDSVLKLFNYYKNSEIIDKIKSWRSDDNRFTSLEMKVDDKNICAHCGHLGKTQAHTRSGCGTCRTHTGCDVTLWKEQRLSIKAELALRKKALLDPNFPSQEIIDEFMSQPATLPKIELRWKHPNLVKFVRSVGRLLEWPEVYCVQKFLPILTRWQLKHNNSNLSGGYLVPDFIHKKRTLKGIPSFEIVWKDDQKFFYGLIPEDQIKSFADDHPKGVQELWSTVEPIDLVERAYPSLVEKFLASKAKPKKIAKISTRKPRPKKDKVANNNSSLNDMNALLKATEEIAKSIKPKKGLQMLDKFLVKTNTPNKSKTTNNNYSTPKSSLDFSYLESDNEDLLNMSEIVQGIVQSKPLLEVYSGNALFYESITLKTQDDISLLPSHKRDLSISFLRNSPKRISLDDSCIGMATSTLGIGSPITQVDRFKEKQFNRKSVFSGRRLSGTKDANNVSYFFENSFKGEDEFEKSFEESFLKNDNELNDDGLDMIVISDDDD